MAALRQLVRGSDVCAPSDGSGSGAVHAASSLADQLLGRTNKAQERLREVRRCCRTDLPPPPRPDRQRSEG